MASKQPKVAVITRTKNRTVLLKRALESVQSQTNRDFVQVIVNDGGDKAAVEKLAKKYPQEHILILHNETSVGHTKALNQGIKAVQSTYVAVLDDDDSWSADCLENVIPFLDKTDAKGVVVIMDRIIEEIKGQSVHEISRNRWLPDQKYISLYEQCLDNYLATNCFIYRRDVYNELGGYDEKLGVAEDWDFGLRFLMKYDVELLQTEHPLAFYHHRPEMKGDSGNSVFAGVASHQYHQNMLANKYLREDIRSGNFGVGYIINSLKHERNLSNAKRAQELEDVIRIEGHMNYVGKSILDGILEEVRQNTQRILSSNVTYRVKKLLRK